MDSRVHVIEFTSCKHCIPGLWDSSQSFPSEELSLLHCYTELGNTAKTQNVLTLNIGTFTCNAVSLQCSGSCMVTNYTYLFWLLCDDQLILVCMLLR